MKRLGDLLIGRIDSMKELFLSASIPLIGRGDFHETANPFLIQCAVRELILAVIKTHKIVWGGHPAITPMVWAICQDLGIEYSKAVILYQSKFFEDEFPEENKNFNNVEYVENVNNDREASLLNMRKAMLSRKNLKAAVFIGGMNGVEEEYKLFEKFHPQAKILFVPSPGGAARQLAQRTKTLDTTYLDDVNFSDLFRRELLIQM